jgi:hypothetical protein
MKLEPVRLSELRVGAIINTSSGGCDLESEEKMLNIFKAAGIVEPKTWCGRSDQIERSLAEAFGQKLEVLVVLGATAPFEQPQKDALKRASISSRFPGGR